MSDSERSSPSSVYTGNVLGAKYRLERELGRGAMGTVWSATHLSLDQLVAIKIISAEHADSEEARQRFRTEARAAARLRSRYVVQVYDDGETPEGLPYIVMEYLEGETLDDLLMREGDLPIDQTVRIAGHIARALSRAHARGIVHRDLKPANVFLTRTEDDEQGWLAKVLDFGIAKVEDNREQSQTKAGTVLGTPLFMSPEQVRGASSVDQRADLYSLGMVVYNMITGSYAFEASSFGGLLVAICTDPLPAMREAAPWVPEPLDLWYQKACAKLADERFQNADEMLRALLAATEQSLAGQPSFADESSAVLDGPFTAPSTMVHGTGSAAESAAHSAALAAAKTQHAEISLIDSSGPQSVTISGIPTKRRWVWPAALGGVAVLGLAVLLLGVGGSEGAASTSPTQPAASAGTDEADLVLSEDKDTLGAAEVGSAEAEPAPTASEASAETPPSATSPQTASAPVPKKVKQVQPKPQVRKTSPSKPRATPKKQTKKSVEVDVGF